MNEVYLKKKQCIQVICLNLKFGTSAWQHNYSVLQKFLLVASDNIFGKIIYRLSVMYVFYIFFLFISSFYIIKLSNFVLNELHFELKFINHYFILWKKKTKAQEFHDYLGIFLCIREVYSGTMAYLCFLVFTITFL